MLTRIKQYTVINLRGSGDLRFAPTCLRIAVNPSLAQTASPVQLRKFTVIANCGLQVRLAISWCRYHGFNSRGRHELKLR
jgi:hypothetical protein